MKRVCADAVLPNHFVWIATREAVRQCRDTPILLGTAIIGLAAYGYSYVGGLALIANYGGFLRDSMLFSLFIDRINQAKPVQGFLIVHEITWLILASVIFSIQQGRDITFAAYPFC